MSIAHTPLRELVAALARAQRAMHAGDRDGARLAAAEALAIDPQNVQARTLLDEMRAADAAPAQEARLALRAAGPGRAPPGGSVSSAAHGVVNVASWTVFEQRVRERRMQRLIGEAETAIREGNAEGAARALEELEALAPGDDRIGRLHESLTQASVLTTARREVPSPLRVTPAVPAPAAVAEAPGAAQMSLAGDEPWRSSGLAEPDGPIERPRAGWLPRRMRTAALAAAVVLAALLGGWTAHRQATSREHARAGSNAFVGVRPAGPLPGIPAYEPGAIAPAGAPQVSASVPSLAIPAGESAEPERTATTSSTGRESMQTATGVDRPPGLPAADRPTAAPPPSPPPAAHARSAAVAPADRVEERPAAPSPPEVSTLPEASPDASAPARPAAVDRQMADATSPAGAPAARPLPPSTAAPAPPVEVPRASAGREPPAATATTGTAPPSVVDPAARASAAGGVDAGARSVLDAYRHAYNTLDASAAQRVWPTVDARALERAFRQLSTQSLSFDQCDVTTSGASAQAVCSGRASWAPAVGDRSPRAEPRTWRFVLSQRGPRWVITNVAVDRR